MWRLDNRTPFAAERTWVRDRDGAEIWVVALKCTFDIFADGTTAISAVQPPVLRVAEYHGEPGKSSIKLESDLIPTKTTTDIVLIGHAYAPHATPVTRMDVGLRVGPVQKVLRVHGDRTWTTLGPSSPHPFVKMPLVYERAYGGVDQYSGHPERDWDWRNPVGVAFAVSRGHLKGRPLPNIEYPDDPFISWSDRPRPAGFGPIASHWQPRASFAGTYDDRWMQERQPLLPDDFDDRYFQIAPPDQQAPEFLRGGEPVILRGLTPTGDVRFQLPRVFPGFETHFLDGSREIHQHRKLHSIILEPDYPRVSVVWHTTLPCHFRVQKLDRTILTLKAALGDETPLLAPDVLDQEDDTDEAVSDPNDDEIDFGDGGEQDLDDSDLDDDEADIAR
jgi:hypothetical protein